jgi:hypothetical protein
MYNCRQVREDASSLVDGELSWTGTLAMRMHLLFCGSCRRFVRQLRLLVSALGSCHRAARLPSSAAENVLAVLPFDTTGSSFEPPGGST